MEAKVARWGNSLALRIPKGLAASHRISEGSSVEIIEDDNELRLRPVESKRYELSELLKGVTPENLHEEFSSGDPQGKEAW